MATKKKEEETTKVSTMIPFDSAKTIIRHVLHSLEIANDSIQKAVEMIHHIDVIADPEHIKDLDAIAEKLRKEVRETIPVDDAIENGDALFGEFDGYFMIGEDMKKYPVPINYASKSKLVPGDKLKLSITKDGKMIYKLIAPCDRKHIRAVLSKDETKFIAITSEGASYILNQAAVVFFRGRPGDEVYISINKQGIGRYAALEAIIKS